MQKYKLKKINLTYYFRKNFTKYTKFYLIQKITVYTYHILPTKSNTNQIPKPYP